MKFKWLPKNKADRSSINVSSYGPYPYSLFSPFSHHPSYSIPVPGHEKKHAHSVEGIWQGLKMINGKTDENLFYGKPRKRRGPPEGHLYKKIVLPYLEARKKIYLPAYTYHALNNALPEAIKDLESRLKKGKVTFYDTETNPDINDETSPLSHAALLVDLLNLLHPSPLPPFNKKRFTYLDEQLKQTLQYREKITEKYLLDEIVAFAYLHSRDELKSAFALRYIKETRLKDRLRNYQPTKKTRAPYNEAVTSFS